MPFVCTGNLGSRYEYGQPVPEAIDWPPNMLALHLRAGTIQQVSDSDAARMEIAWQSRRLASRAKQLKRGLITAENLLTAARANVKRLSDELAHAKLDLDKREADTKAARDLLADALAQLPKEAESPPIKAPAPAPAPVLPKAPVEPPSDESLRKTLFVEIAPFGRAALVKYAGGDKPKWDDAGKLIQSGYGIDLSKVAHEDKSNIQRAFIEARLAQLKAEAKAKSEADQKPADAPPAQGQEPKADEAKSQPKAQQPNPPKHHGR